MKHKASWNNTRGYKYLILFMIILFLGFGLFLEVWFSVLLGFIILLYFIILPFRIYAILLEDKIIYQGWFNKSEVLYNEVISLTGSDAFKYPKNRYYGPHTYEVRTENKYFLINLLFFNSDFNKRFHDILKMKRKYKRNGS